MDSASQSVIDIYMIYVYLGCLVALTILVVIVGVAIHRRIAADKDTSSKEAAFSLAELSRLRTEGQITDAEYDRVRAMMIGESMTALDTDNATPAPPGGGGSNPKNDRD